MWSFSKCEPLGNSRICSIDLNVSQCNLFSCFELYIGFVSLRPTIYFSTISFPPTFGPSYSVLSRDNHQLSQDEQLCCLLCTCTVTLLHFTINRRLDNTQQCSHFTDARLCNISLDGREGQCPCMYSQ